MLKNFDLTSSAHPLSDSTFKPIRGLQRERLFELEEMIYEAKVPVFIVFEGWDASGKGAAIRELTRRLDPRGFKVYQTQAPRTLEKKMPWLWRFWMQIPRRGQIAIFDRSWYGRVLVERVEGQIPIPDWIRAYEEINNFERTLAADGAVFVKYWLQITEKEQLCRFIEMSNDPLTAWEITAEDWQRHRRYKEYEAAVNDMLENTSSPNAPWIIVSATDMNYCIYQVYRELINTLERCLGVEQTQWDAQPSRLKEEKTHKNAVPKMPEAEKKPRKKAMRKAPSPENDHEQGNNDGVSNSTPEDD